MDENWEEMACYLQSNVDKLTTECAALKTENKILLEAAMGNNVFAELYKQRDALKRELLISGKFEAQRIVIINKLRTERDTLSEGFCLYRKKSGLLKNQINIVFPAYAYAEKIVDGCGCISPLNTCQCYDGLREARKKRENAESAINAAKPKE